MMTFSLMPRRSSVLPQIAASVRTLVVSWKDEAEMNDSVESDAFVIPSSIGSATDFAAANRLFQRNVADLRACYGQARFMNDYEGDGRDPREPVNWNVTLEGPDFRLELQMSNRVALVAQAMGQGSSDMPEITIELDVTDTSPPKTPI